MKRIIILILFMTRYDGIEFLWDHIKNVVIDHRNKRLISQPSLFGHLLHQKHPRLYCF